MLNHPITAVIIGTALGFLAGLGVGGGSLLLLWLTAVAGMEHGDARMINLLFFLPAAFIATLFRWRQGRLPLKEALPAMAAGAAAAILASGLSRSIDVAVLKKMLGILLLVTGLRELFYRRQNAR